MKRIKLSREFKFNGLIIFVALFCLSTYAFLEHMSNSIGMFSRMKMPLLYAGFVCVLLQLKTVFKCVLRKKVFFILLALFVFCLGAMIAMVDNLDTNLGEAPIRKTGRLLLYVVEVFLLMIAVAETGRGQAVLKFLFWYLLLIVVANDILMFTPIVRFRIGRHENYLVGTKFSVVYVHMNLLMLWMLRRKRSSEPKEIPWFVVLLITLYSILVSVRVDCMTGVVACVVLVVLLMMLENRRWQKMVRFTSPWVLLAALMASVVFTVVVDTITQIPQVKYLIEYVLNRDTSLTGRAYIYQMYADRMEEHWLTGYGYGNANAVANALFGFQTMQNGLLQWALEIGLLGTFPLVGLLMQVFYWVNRSSVAKRISLMPLIALVYVYVILATVETTINMAFFMWFALLFMMVNEKTENLPE